MQPRIDGVVVEVAVDSLAGAAAAAAAGAGRLEVCAGLEVGGLTPGTGLLQLLLERVPLPLHALLRPRPGDFLYDDGEFETLRREVLMAREIGLQGVVVGILRRDGSLDRDRMAALVELASPLTVTCHRAFDMCADRQQALEALVEVGVVRVLSSGGQGSAREGAGVLASAVQQARGRIEVMAVGGIRADHAVELVARTGVQAVHLSASRLEPSPMAFRNPDVAMAPIALPGEYELRRTDGAEIARLVAALRQDP